MNYNYLRYFSVLAQVEHYTIAAARLDISQPSLSSAIRNLENELGVKLFEKVGRNIRLTEQGRYFQKKVDAAMAELNAATQILKESAAAPVVIRLGFVSGTLQGTMAQQILDFQKRQPRCRFHITEGSAKDLMDLLRQEKLDMAVVDVAVRDRSLHFRKLRERDFYVAVPTGHPLAEEPSLTVSQLTPYPQIGFSHSMDKSFENWASNLDVQSNFYCQVNTVRGALSLVAEGVGIAIVPDECILTSKDIRYIPLENRHQALYLCLVYDRWLEPPLWEFMEQTVKAIRKKAKG